MPTINILTGPNSFKAFVDKKLNVNMTFSVFDTIELW